MLKPKYKRSKHKKRKREAEIEAITLMQEGAEEVETFLRSRASTPAEMGLAACRLTDALRKYSLAEVVILSVPARVF